MEKSDIRSRIFAGGTRARETVTLGDVQIDVVALSNAARGRVMNECMVIKPGEDEDDVQEMDMVKLGPTLVIECAFFQGTDEPVFTEADREQIGASSAGYFDTVVKAASRLSGLGKSAVTAALGNSAPATT